MWKAAAAGGEYGRKLESVAESPRQASLSAMLHNYSCQNLASSRKVPP